MLETGTSHLTWTPNPNETYDGITKIDRDGVMVSQSDYDGYTQMKTNGFYVNDGKEDVIKVTSNGATFKGLVIIEKGSEVPTTTLIGSISDSQLDSTIVSDISTAKTNANSALSTANKANTTATTANSNASTALTTANKAMEETNIVASKLDDNFSNWNKAYSQMLEWSYDASYDATLIDGGFIQTNTISANKIALGDFNNYATVNEFYKESMLPSTFRYGGTKIQTGANQCISSTSETKRYIMLSDFTRTNFNQNDEIYVEGYLYSHHTEVQQVRCSVWGYDSDKTFVSGTTGSCMFDLQPGVWTRISGTIKLTDAYWGTNNVVYHIVGILLSDGNESLKTNLYVRGFSFRRKSNGELIVDGSITADKIAGKKIEGITLTGCLIEATDEIAFVHGARMFGNKGAFGAGLQISTTSFNLPDTSFGYLAGDWEFTSGSVTIEKNLTTNGSIYAIGDIVLSNSSLYSPVGTANRDYLRLGNLVWQSDNTNGMLLTDTNGAWATLKAGNMYANNVILSSDKRLKTDIKYVNVDKQEENAIGLMCPNTNITTKDMYDFIEELPMVSYRLIDELNTNVDETHYGFIAQDILYTKVGSELIKIPRDEYGNEIEGYLKYSESKFLSFVCGALQEEIKKVKELEERINELENLTRGDE
jgi:hypothetical protein